MLLFYLDEQRISLSHSLYVGRQHVMREQLHDNTNLLLTNYSFPRNLKECYSSTQNHATATTCGSAYVTSSKEVPLQLPAAIGSGITVAPFSDANVGKSLVTIPIKIKAVQVEHIKSNILYILSSYFMALNLNYSYHNCKL